jgi:hypothetical protein
VPANPSSQATTTTTTTELLERVGRLEGFVGNMSEKVRLLEQAVVNEEEHRRQESGNGWAWWQYGLAFLGGYVAVSLLSEALRSPDTRGRIGGHLASGLSSGLCTKLVSKVF